MPASQPRSFFPLPQPPRMPHRRPHLLARVVSTLGIAGVLVLLGVGFLAWNFDPDSYRPRLEAAISAATGRSFTIGGHLTVVSWFTPTIAVTDVTLANPAGSASPEMLKVPRAEADLGLRALFAGRLDIARLVLIGPELTLERAADGTPNWRLAPAPGASSPPVTVRTLHVKDGRVVWRARESGKAMALAVSRLSATNSRDGGATEWVADLQLAATRMTLTGRTGPLTRLLRPGEADPWNVYLRAAVPGGQFTVTGSVSAPWQPAGYDLTVAGTLDDPATLDGIAALVGETLGPFRTLRRLQVSAQLSDASGAPALVTAAVRVGPGDLSALVPGLQLDSASLSATTAGAPARFTVLGNLATQPLEASGSLGTLALLRAALAGRGPLPLDASLVLGSSRIEARGTLGDPLSGAGADLLLSARIRDLPAFSPLAFRQLPPLADLSATAHLVAAPGGWRGGWRLPEFTLVLPQGDIAGAFGLASPPEPGARPAISLRLRGSRLDLDALATRLGDYRLLPRPAGPPTAALPIARTVRPLVPDHPLDLAALRAANLDLALDFGEIDWGGLPFKDVTATVAIADGKLVAGPVRAQLAGGPVSLSASLDAATTPPRVRVKLAAPALSVRPLLQSLGGTMDATGTLALAAELSASGPSLHAWAASATGHLGASIVDGSIDNAVLLPAFAGILRVAHLPPDLLFSPGSSRLRCFALRLDAEGGYARLATLLIDAERAVVQADGTLNLGEEAMDLRLRPVLRVGRDALLVPLLLTGSFRSPVLALDKSAVTGDVASALAAAARQRIPDTRPLLTGEALAAADQCGSALAVARGAGGGAVPAAAPPTVLPAAPHPVPGRAAPPHTPRR